MSAQYIPKVGDRVIITKGHSSWNNQGKMDKYIGLELTISSISPNGDRAEFKEVEGAEDINDWFWSFRQGHFKLISKAEPDDDIAAQYIPKVGDRVIITKSNINWDEDMDGYDGLELTILSISPNGDYAKFKEVEGMESINTYWTWNFRQGHFKLINKKEPEFIFGI